MTIYDNFKLKLLPKTVSLTFTDNSGWRHHSHFATVMTTFLYYKNDYYRQLQTLCYL